MTKTKYRIDALFIAIGFYYAFTGKVSIFVAFLAASLLHELAHQGVAKSLGYARGRVSLTPYGAVLSDVSGVMNMASDLKISLAGVGANLLTMAALLGLWWLFPSTYTYTIDFFRANAFIAIFNIFPAFPLDGARVVLALGNHNKRLLDALKAVSCILGALMTVLGIISVGYRINPSLIVTGSFLIFGALIGSERDKYFCILKSMPELKDYTMPVEKRRFVVSGNMKLRSLVKLVKRDSLSEFELFVNGKKLLITEKILSDAVKNYNLNTTLNEIILFSMLK